MNGVIYARYSSLGQREQSIEDQINDCLEYAKDNNINIIKTYADYAKSGRSDNRDEFQKMLKDSDSKAFEVVLVWKLDRFGRNREEMAVNKLKLKKNGVTLISAKENIPNDPSGIILESVMEGLAEYYSANLAQNVKRGMHSNALKAMVNGQLPLGLKKSKDSKIVIDEEKAPIVRLIYQLYIDGYTRAEILRYLDEHNLRNKKGKKIQRGTLDNILSNPKYIGTYVYGDVIIPDAFEPLLDKEVFFKAQELNKVSSYHKRSKGEYYLLSGLLKCGVCGELYTSESGTSRSGEKYHYYKCRARKKKASNCNNDILKKEEIEEAVLEITFNEVLKDEIIDELAKRVVSFYNKDSSNNKLPALKKQKQDTENRLNNLLNALELGNVSELIVTKINELETELSNIKGLILAEEVKYPSPKEEAVRWALKNFKTKYIKSEHDKITFINNFINSIVYTKGIVTIYYNYCFPGESGTFLSQECSVNVIMARQNETILNTVEFYDEGYLSYSFNLKEYKLAS